MSILQDRLSLKKSKREYNTLLIPLKNKKKKK